MAIENPLRSAVTLKLNAGARPGTGTMITKNVSLGRITENADKDKIMTIVAALTPCLALPVVRVERTEVTTLEA